MPEVLETIGSRDRVYKWSNAVTATASRREVCFHLHKVFPEEKIVNMGKLASN
jgi:hypothetical protein